MKASRQLRIKLVCILLGLAATLFAGVGFYTGLFGRLELLTLDLRFRHFNSVRDSGKLCIIGIDDSSLESIGDWPWPRTHLAKILDLLKTFGSKNVLIDLIYRKPRLQVVGKNADGTSLTEDQVFAQSLRDNGKVTLACFFEEGLTNPRLSGVVDVLASNFTMPIREISRKTNVSEKIIKNQYATLRRYAARKVIYKILKDNPSMKESLVYEKILGKNFSELMNQNSDLREAYNYVKSYLIIRSKSGWIIDGKIPKVVKSLDNNVQMVLPVSLFSQNCMDCGFVSFKRDFDGKVRSIQLLADYKKRIYRQIAFATLLQYLKVEPENLRIGGDLLQIYKDKKKLFCQIPLVDNGKLIVNWYAPHHDKWQKSFKNVIPAAAILELAFDKKNLAIYQNLLRTAMGITVKEFLPKRYKRYCILKARIPLFLASTNQIGGTSTQPKTAPTLLEQNLIDEYQATTKQLKQIESDAKEQLDWLYQQVQALSPTEKHTKNNQAIANLWYSLNQPEKIRQKIIKLRTNIDEKEKRIKPMVNGKIVLIGYTASTLADFVSTPVFKETPGLLVHANILNQILNKSFLIRAERNSDLLVILLAGMIITLLSAERLAFEAFVWMLGLLAGFWFLSCYLLFEKMHLIVSIVGPTAAIVLSWMVVSVYREITEGRTKRLFASRLGQYTNATLVQRIVEDPNKLVMIPEERLVTCFFSDLAGFTSISEKLGPEDTVRLLNIYLEHMSEMLDKHEGFINKFQGDGIFAFFNPPLHPQPDHARLACLAAIDSQIYLPHVQKHLEEENLVLDKPLKMRIGISSGKAVVGDCGSTRKFDYTCLGDTVNLAARLEPANKVFGTEIMISENTFHLIGDDIRTRLLGKLRVVGKEKSVIVYEVIGRKKDHRDNNDYIKTFEDMVKAFWSEDFELVAKLLNKLPEDKSTALYRKQLHLIKQDRLNFTGGVIELATK